MGPAYLDPPARVAGYAEVMETIFEHAGHIPFTENHLKQRHTTHKPCPQNEKPFDVLVEGLDLSKIGVTVRQ